MTDGWVTGDHVGVRFPAHPAALRDGGPAFLTDAFRAAGVLGADNRVVSVARCGDVTGGSTGRKMLLDVTYARPQPALRTDLFVKFSRDLDDPVRDRGRTQMAGEVAFARLAMAVDLPVAVPRPQFADYHTATGTGILIAERITFGDNGIEPQYHKCLDYTMPDAAGHYRALLTALAQLAGADRSGALPAGLTDALPVDLRAATVAEPPPVPAEKLDRRVRQLADFAVTHPGLLPERVRAADFLGRLPVEARRVRLGSDAVWRALAEASDYLALSHWNANVDNAWFWRDRVGTLHCGLLDWGCVSRLNVAMALWGSLSAAETTMWDECFDEFCELFCAVAAEAGGPDLDPATLRRFVVLYAIVMGATWLLDVPALLRTRLPDAGPDTTRFDLRIAGDESLRAPLQMLTNVLNLWATHDVAAEFARLPG
ncbi:hypothetical protein E4P42_26070 [Mycobacterium sp. PS03-16]|uniref:hypothetical protein n=1 Tax=Mycobacterium sp. PS03-16 TaxID=2559611 RepID=UPI001073B06E|nr:hypothetical protein [Mycobacterium sp. PS03-16]TFV54425.1 hypothetical protein E4P42_26070 [Mycobacterium sp. PS03-16]